VQQIPGVTKHLFVQVTQLNQNILKIEKTMLSFITKQACRDESVVFFCFQYVSRSTLVYRALYYGKIETLTSN